MDFDNFIGFLLFLGVLSIIFITFYFNFEEKKEIIRSNIDDYVIYDECFEIDNKYYCK